MANINASTERLGTVDNVSGCTNFGCMALDGAKAWALKTKSDESLNVLYCYDNYNDDKPRATYEFKGKYSLGHGNTMTSSEKYLFFGCSNAGKYIIRIPKTYSGKESDIVKITTEQEISSMAYYKKYHFIYRTKDEDRETLFAIGKTNVVGNTGTMKEVPNSRFYVKNTAGLPFSQDIFYDTVKGLFFVIHNNKDGKPRLNNRISVINMAAGTTETYKGRPIYTARDIITIDKRNKENFDAYEVESLALGTARRIIMACNISRKALGLEDAFQRINNVQF